MIHSIPFPQINDTVRRALALTAIALLAFLSLSAQEPGVARSLAVTRAIRVSNITYQLNFRIPDNLAQPVTGRLRLSFHLTNTKTDLPLDFAGKDVQHLGHINGKSFKAEWQSEHILLPHQALRRGLNVVDLVFTAADKSLNRHADYLYSLFVPANARTVFPCFDQPDLKALFKCTLQAPDGWVSRCSDSTHVLPTYLFSFVAGKFQTKTVVRDGRHMTALYRETDPAKVAQLDKCFDEAALALRWLERYTARSCPFSDYGFVVLPGYQFGGMEHPGAIQFTDREIFLGPQPTPDEEMTRLQLIAHETAHLWFGDMVTMRWFDDVWTKEVFANFMASKIAREQFPLINHDLNFLKSYYPRAMSTDRTLGTHPIQQPLDNLNRAGLLYGNIIYEKAPIMMDKLEQQMGPDAFREGLRRYLKTFAYANATWNDLVAIFDSVAPQAHVRQFSDVWVREKGVPVISYRLHGDTLTVRQSDPFHRSLFWPQRATYGLLCGDSLIPVTVDFHHSEVHVKVPCHPETIIPNINGQGYGRFIINDSDRQGCAAWMTRHIHDDNTAAYSVLLTLYENYLLCTERQGVSDASTAALFQLLCNSLTQCQGQQTASTLCRNLASLLHLTTDKQQRDSMESRLFALSASHPLKAVRQQLTRSLANVATSKVVTGSLYRKWLCHDDTLLNERDYTRLAYHLALILPDSCQHILATQHQRIKTTDEQREFDFIARACTSDTAAQHRLFLSLIPKSGRLVEPWAESALSLLCDPTRETQANNYLKPGLDAIVDIQQTSDIFFPGYWLSALMDDHHSAEARQTVNSWIADHERQKAWQQGLRAALMNKIKENAYWMLLRPAKK